jgi:hypothetical protein|nr:MAG TPA: hypothetical protein [Caudoviricetes sp.]
MKTIKSTNPVWVVEGPEGDEWMRGTEQECKEYCDSYGYLFTRYSCPSQQRMVVFMQVATA